jgi:hypothetical protein
MLKNALLLALHVDGIHLVPFKQGEIGLSCSATPA